MYELYELMFDIFFPKRVVRLIESLLSARALQLTWACILTYYCTLFVWHGSQWLRRLYVAKSQPQPSISGFWQIASIALLATHLHLRIVMAGQ